jgi:hypothetical protein
MFNSIECSFSKLKSYKSKHDYDLNNKLLPSLVDCISIYYSPALLGKSFDLTTPTSPLFSFLQIKFNCLDMYLYSNISEVEVNNKIEFESDRKHPDLID